ncbi:MAG TPA: hypothetical protein PK830_08810 [Candidatus Atribacteria bacterium]|nr:hypothetical protein [Candidatus Atribacteria bacterium]HPT79185.1 hypothetical protein [Candidatus Atribacteria bacterium]
MQDIIEKIISLDKSARKAVESAEQRIRQKEEQAKAEIEEYRAKAISSAREKGRSVYEEKIKAAYKEADVYGTESDRKVAQLEEHFLCVKGRMEAEILKRIIPEAEEGNMEQ